MMNRLENIFIRKRKQFFRNSKRYLPPEEIQKLFSLFFISFSALSFPFPHRLVKPRFTASSFNFLLKYIANKEELKNHIYFPAHRLVGELKITPVMLIKIICFIIIFTFYSFSQPRWILSPSSAGHNTAVGATSGIVDIDIYRSNPDTIYAIGYDSTIRSKDRGNTWNFISAAYAGFGSIRVDPFNSKTVYISCSGLGYYTSNDVCFTYNIDSANAWRILGIGEHYEISALEIDPVDHNIVYAGLGPNYIFKTTDKGRS